MMTVSRHGDGPTSKLWFLLRGMRSGSSNLQKTFRSSVLLADPPTMKVLMQIGGSPNPPGGRRSRGPGSGNPVGGSVGSVTVSGDRGSERKREKATKAKRRLQQSAGVSWRTEEGWRYQSAPLLRSSPMIHEGIVCSCGILKSQLERTESPSSPTFRIPPKDPQKSSRRRTSQEPNNDDFLLDPPRRELSPPDRPVSILRVGAPHTPLQRRLLSHKEPQVNNSDCVFKCLSGRRGGPPTAHIPALAFSPRPSSLCVLQPRRSG